MQMQAFTMHMWVGPALQLDCEPDVHLVEAFTTALEQPLPANRTSTSNCWHILDYRNMPPTKDDTQAYLNHLSKWVSLHGRWRHVTRLQDSDAAACVPPDLGDGAATFAQDGPNLLEKLHVSKTILHLLALYWSLPSR